MTKIYDGACGAGEAAKGAELLEARTLFVADVDGNRVPMPMKSIWNTIVDFGYDGDHDEALEGLVVDGQIKVFRSETDDASDHEAAKPSKKQRQAADAVTKVSLLASYWSKLPRQWPPAACHAPCVVTMSHAPLEQRAGWRPTNFNFNCLHGMFMSCRRRNTGRLHMYRYAVRSFRPWRLSSQHANVKVRGTLCQEPLKAWCHHVRDGCAYRTCRPCLKRLQYGPLPRHATSPLYSQI